MLTFLYGKKNAEYCRIVEEEQGKTSIAETKTCRSDRTVRDVSKLQASGLFRPSGPKYVRLGLPPRYDLAFPLFFVITYFSTFEHDPPVPDKL